jgi:hypothetical protein
MMNESQIENALRQAPRPVPPNTLKKRLLNEVTLTNSPQGHRSTACQPPTVGWFRRWWPVLAPSAGCLACAVVITAQQLEINELQRAIQTLSPTVPSVGVENPSPDAKPAATPARTSGASTNQAEEVERLKAKVSQLDSEIRPLEQMRLENDRLRAQLAVPPADSLTPEEMAALAQARERAESIQCVNNLQQLGLASKLWAIDNNDYFPSAVLLMTNEMSTPKILACPGDSAHPAATDWKSFGSGNSSYDYLGASATDAEPNRVIFRCPTHGSVTLADGSVQMGIAKSHPERLVNREGKLFLLER